MQLKYGPYSHDNNELSFVIQKTPIFSRVGVRRGWHEKWVVTGWLQATSQALLTTKMDALEAAYKIDNHDLRFYFDDGTTQTSHSITASQTTGGTKITDFRWLSSRRDEYVRRRSYEITIEADIFEVSINVIHYYESVRQIGTGAPRVKWMGAITGPPQRQFVQQQTTFQTVQSGFAVGELLWPNPADPLWPQFEHQDKRNIEHRSPRHDKHDLREYPVSWRYVFESSASLTGVPAITF